MKWWKSLTLAWLVVGIFVTESSIAAWLKALILAGTLLPMFLVICRSLRSHIDES